MQVKVRLLLFLLLVTPRLWGQEVLSLKECLEAGLQNNYSLQLLRLQESTAKNDNTPGNAGKLPTVNLNMPYSASWLTTERWLREGGSSGSDASLNQSLSPNVGLSWSIFEGYAARFTSEKLRLQYDAAQLQTRKGIEEYTSGLIAEYYTLLYQLQQLENMKSSVSLSNERVQIVRDRYLLGSGSKLDLLQAQVDLNVDSSKLVSLYETVTSTRIRLREMMADDRLDLLFMPADTLIPINKFLSSDSLMAQMNRNNVMLLAVKYQKLVSEADYAVIRSASYPYVRANASVSTQMSAYGKGATERQLVVGPSFGLSMGLNLYDGLNQRRRERNAQTLLAQRDVMIQETLLALKADLMRFFTAYTNNIYLLDLETENVRVAKENLDIARERYLLGDLAGIEMREAQQQWLDARQRRILVNYQAKLAEISLCQLAGQLTLYLFQQ